MRIRIAEDRTGRRAARMAETPSDELECFRRGLAQGQPDDRLGQIWIEAQDC